MNEKTILFQYNVDMDGNPVSVKLKDESQVSTLKHNIQLEQLPDEQYGVVVLDASGNPMKEVYNYDDLENKPNAYYVNYTTGIVHFNSSQSAERKIINYYGTGVELISAKRVFDGYYDANGKWVTKILQDIIDAGREPIKLMTSVGDIATILQLLETKMAEGDLKLQELQNAIDEANDLTKVTGNEEVIIGTSDWVSDGNGGYYAIVNHNCNSENIHVTFKRTATKENMTLGYTIINNNSFKVFNHESVTTSCIISAMYYRATLTISDDIAREVVDARKGYQTVGERLDTQLDNIENNKASLIELEVERKRIDSLINQGNGVDNAETSDIRVSASGLKYTSAGNSVRETQKGNAILDDAITPRHLSTMKTLNLFN